MSETHSQPSSKKNSPPRIQNSEQGTDFNQNYDRVYQEVTYESQIHTQKVTQRIVYENNGQKSKQSKQAVKKEKKLKIFKPDSQESQPPTQEEIMQFYQYVKISTTFFFKLVYKFIMYSYFLVTATVSYIGFGIKMSIMKYFMKLVAFIDTHCCKKFNKKDPFKRHSKSAIVKFQQIQKLKKNYGPKKFTLVLDLDGTLVYSSNQKQEDALVVPVTFTNGDKSIYYVKKRPYLDEFLQRASELYNIVVYTASWKEYADEVIDAIDKYGVLKQRLYRNDCSPHPDGYLKSLDKISKETKNVVMIDNSKHATQTISQNTLNIHTYRGEIEEKEEYLQQYLGILEDMVNKESDFIAQIEEIKKDYSHLYE